MLTLLVVLAAITAIAAAIRSTWSPCGLSMLSTITPLAESGRGHRFRWTASWFLVGSVVGGATLGLGAALAAWVLGALGLGVSAALGIAAVAALVTAASDLRVFGVQLPIHPRQVNETWLNRFRSWVYGAGFGWQIGTGFVTYIMTAAVYLTAVLAALTASPAIAFALGTLFGLVRGLAIFLGARITTTERLVAFHHRFDVLAEPVRLTAIGVQLAVAVALASAVWGIAGAAVSLVVIAAGLGSLRLRQREQAEPAAAPVVARS